MHEHHFICPHCWQNISMLIDTSVENQTYIEDCEVCCRPISVSVLCESGEIVSFDAAAGE